jgi:small multidrug resistance family-3 protein
MSVLRSVVIFVAAALGELAGTYAVWRWVRGRATPLLGLAGVAALFAYALVQTLQPEPRYGRVYAAYAGVFLLGAMLWGWAVDGRAPDRFDVAGALLVLAGVVVIMWGRRLLG